MAATATSLPADFPGSKSASYTASIMGSENGRLPTSKDALEMPYSILDGNNFALRDVPSHSLAEWRPPTVYTLYKYHRVLCDAEPAFAGLQHGAMSHRSPSREVGFKVLVPENSDGDSGVTFVLVPGVGTPAPREWAFASPVWLGQILPQACRARVLAFDVHLQLDNFTCGSLLDEGRNFLTCLDQEASNRQWPIVVACHSLGGLIVKQAVHLGSFKKNEFRTSLNAISGIFFLGTPHLQHDPQKLYDVLNAITTCCSKDGLSRAAVSTLQSEVATLCDMAKSFQDTTSSLTVGLLSAYEGLSTRIPTRSFRKAKEIIVVGEVAATIKARDEQVVEILSDHMDLPKLHRHDSSAHSELLDSIKILISLSLEIITQKLKASEISSETSISESDPSSLGHGFRRSLGRGDSRDGSRNMALSTTTIDDLEPITPFDSFVVEERKQAKLPCFMLQTFDQNINFHGRGDIFRQMDTILLPTPSEGVEDDKSLAEVRCVTLHGPPGIGKTELAVQYAYTRRERFDGVFWIHADDNEKIEADFAQITVALGLETTDAPRNPIVSRDIAKEWLSNPTKHPARKTEASWLIIFDNADKPDLVADYVQNLGNGALLVTTRDPDAKDLFPPSTVDIAIEPLSEQEGAALLETLTTNARKKPDKGRSVEIVQQLNGFPLAITQMAFYIRNTRLNYTEFLETYEDMTEHEQLHEQMPSQQRKTARGSIASVWAIEQLSEVARSLLEVLAFLDPDSIHESLLLDPKAFAILTKFCGLSPKTLKRSTIHRARAELIQSSLIRKNEELKTWRVHRLLQDTVIAKLLHDPEKLLSRFQAAVSAVLSAWPETSPDKLHAIKNWEICKRIYPHVLALRDRDSTAIRDQTSEGIVEFATLLNRAAWWQYERGDSRALQPLAELALQVCDKCDLTNNGDANLKSDIYYSLGARGTEANDGISSLKYNKLFLNSRLEIQTRTGISDDRLGKAHNQLGISWMMHDKIEQAIELFQKALDIYRPLHNLQLLAMPTANLGLAYWLQGPEKYAAAIATLDQGLAERVELHGPDDVESFRTGRLLHAMGNVKESQNLLIEAEKYHRKALRQYQMTIGDDHHRTADVRHRVARHCFRKGEFAKAKDLIDQALKVWNADKPTYRNEIARTSFLRSQVLAEIAGEEKSSEEAGAKAISLYEEITKKSLKTKTKLEEANFDSLVCFWSR